MTSTSALTRETSLRCAFRSWRCALGSWRCALRSWRSVVGLSAVIGGAVVVIGCLLPWAEAFAGLVRFAGISGGNGRLLAAAGGLTALAGLWHLVRGGAASRWVAGLAGFAVLGYSGLLLLRLAGTLRSLGGSDMVILRGGPGLWVVAAGAMLAFGTLFMPDSGQRSLRAHPEAGTGLVTWAADTTSAGARRKLQIALGLIWLVDAALQFQPFMFGRGLVTQVIDPAAMGSPAIVAGSVSAAGQVMLAHPVLFNAAFATVQLLLGLGLLWRRTTRAALAGTIAWSLSVWWFGEAFGGLLSGMANPLTGAPGAALLYVLIAVLAWPRAAAPGLPHAAGPGGRVTGRQALADSSLLGRPASRLAWIVVWGGFAALMLQRQVRAPGAVRDALGRDVPAVLGSGGPVPALIVAVLFAVVAAGILVPRARRQVLVLAAVVALAIWVLGEHFGGITSGTATDLNSGPLLLLLVAAYWPGRLAQQEVGGVELAGAAPEVEGEARPQRQVAALAVQVPAGAAGAPDGLR
jgi:hypothetical protein